MNVKPLLSQVIIKQMEARNQTKSGILIAETAKERPERGKVIAVGDGKWDMYGEKRIPVDVSPGDEVFYNKYGAIELKVEDEEYIVVDAESIYLIFSATDEGGTTL
ncbi:MAG: co-chaperone GroES [Coriobacteriia bacterium]|nr:co-chaperone GroES [Coriobacteriia bacterium]